METNKITPEDMKCCGKLPSVNNMPLKGFPGTLMWISCEVCGRKSNPVHSTQPGANLILQELWLAALKQPVL